MYFNLRNGVWYVCLLMIHLIFRFFQHFYNLFLYLLIEIREPSPYRKNSVLFVFRIPFSPYVGFSYGVCFKFQFTITTCINFNKMQYIRSFAWSSMSVNVCRLNNPPDNPNHRYPLTLFALSRLPLQLDATSVWFPNPLGQGVSRDLDSTELNSFPPTRNLWASLVINPHPSKVPPPYWTHSRSRSIFESTLNRRHM